MRKILFVDDEPRVLEGLQSLLRRHRRKWDMAFALGGEAALKLLQTQVFDVLVTDMRMPGIDGVQLLRYAQREHPKTVRIVLSGYMELQATLEAMPVAHQFLSKPCDAQELENVIERASNLQSLMDDERLRQVLGKIEKLPTQPRVYNQLQQAVADENTRVNHIAGIVEQDIAICAKLLQLVNSAFFRLARRITSIEEAVTYLGFNMVKNLVLSLEVFQKAEHLEDFSIETLQRHALQTAAMAKRIVGGREQADDAFMAGMLHDIGHLILAMELPEMLSRSVALADRESLPIYLAEQQLMGVSHAEIGGYLLGLWGLPHPIIEAVANHHLPGRVPQRGFDVLAALYVADHLVHEATEPEGSCEPIDPEYLETLGVGERLEAWRAMAGSQE